MDAEKWIYAEYNEMLKTHKNVKALAIAANKNDAAGENPSGNGFQRVCRDCGEFIPYHEAVKPGYYCSPCRQK